MEASTAERTGAAQDNGTHPDGLHPDEAAALAQDLIIDAGGQLSMSVGGKRATGSSLRIVGGKIEVDGQYEKGQTVHLALECTVGEVAFVDQRDASTGQVVGCERRHKARIVGVSVSE
jgi:ribosomal protein L21E